MPTKHDTGAIFKRRQDICNESSHAHFSTCRNPRIQRPISFFPLSFTPTRDPTLGIIHHILFLYSSLFSLRDRRRRAHHTFSLGRSRNVYLDLFGFVRGFLLGFSVLVETGPVADIFSECSGGEGSIVRVAQADQPGTKTLAICVKPDLPLLLLVDQEGQ